MKPKLFYFDFHGTLEKGNEYAMLDVMNRALEQHGQPKLEGLGFIFDNYGIHWEEYFRLAAPGTSDSDIASMVRYAEANPFSEVKKHISQRDYADEVLLKILRIGHKVILVSNTKIDRLHDYISSVGLDGLFSKVVGVEEKTDIVKYKAEKIMDYADEMKAKSIVVVDDAPAGSQIARLTEAECFYQVLNNGIKPHPQARGIHDLREVLRSI